MDRWLHSLEDIQARLPGHDATFRLTYAVEHGSMRMGLYAPWLVDAQTSHDQDEIYIIVSGAGTFWRNGEEQRVRPNDVIFVEANTEHRFVDFTEDFATWVMLWGPPGGEEHGEPTGA